MSFDSERPEHLGEVERREREWVDGWIRVFEAHAMAERRRARTQRRLQQVRMAAVVVGIICAAMAAGALAAWGSIQ